MKPRRRLVNEQDLPPIHFGLSKPAVDGATAIDEDNHATFFKSYFDKGITLSQRPDLEKKLIVQGHKIEEGDEEGYRRAAYMKEHQVTMKLL